LLLSKVVTVGMPLLSITNVAKFAQVSRGSNSEPKAITFRRLS